MAKLDKNTIKQMANEIRDWLDSNGLSDACTIYFNGMAYKCYDTDWTNDGEYIAKWRIIPRINPKDYFDYAGDILSMSFEGNFYDVMNAWSGYTFKLQDEFYNLLSKYGVYYELGDSWNLTLFPTGR